jgi:hypothetical protein
MKNKKDKSISSARKRAKRVTDHGNDPFFVKKAEESRVFLEKHGFPKELLTRK